MNSIKYQILATLDNADTSNESDLLNAVKNSLNVDIDVNIIKKHFLDLVSQGLIEKSHPTSNELAVTTKGRDCIYQHEFTEEQLTLLRSQSESAEAQANATADQVEIAKADAKTAKRHAIIAECISITSILISILLHFI